MTSAISRSFSTTLPLFFGHVQIFKRINRTTFVLSRLPGATCSHPIRYRTRCLFDIFCATSQGLHRGLQELRLRTGRPLHVLFVCPTWSLLRLQYLAGTRRDRPMDFLDPNFKAASNIFYSNVAEARSTKRIFLVIPFASLALIAPLFPRFHFMWSPDSELLVCYSLNTIIFIGRNLGYKVNPPVFYFRQRIAKCLSNGALQWLQWLQQL